MSFKAPSLLKKVKTSQADTLGNRSYKCNHARCKCCMNIVNGATHIKSFTTGKIFPIKQRLNCGATNIIYVINCTCGIQYVGKTSQTLRMRINNHQYNIVNGYVKHSVSRHAGISRFEDFQVIPIEGLPANCRNLAKTLSRREMFWIYQLNTLSPWIQRGPR